MKQGRELFSHLYFASHKKVEFFSCIKKLKTLLPNRLADGIKNAYIKGDTLYFVLENKALEFEANYKLNSLTPILKDFCRMCDECRELSFQSVKAYAKISLQAPKPDTTFLEKERSDGVFENRFTDETLRLKTEEIRKIICRNASNT